LAIAPTKEKKKVLIIGGGVAGMEAARVATLRGHRVELWEKTNSLGGNANLASKTPWKREFEGVVSYLVNQMKKLDISLKLMTEGTIGKIIQNKPDVLILAMGSRPKTINISGLERDRALLAEDVLNGKLTNLVSPVCIIGGGMVGLETAALVRINGHEVVVVEMLPEVGMDMRAINKAFWLDKIAELGISTYTECQVIDIKDGKLRIKSKGEENLRMLDSFSSYIVAVGYQSNNLLKEELEKEKEKLSFQFYAIGDCVSPRKALDAISEAYLVAHSL
jgi:NADPH-dependent 2,4-dienoyl-CoA reductase/sulfur reductase-like enzyme